MSRSPLFSRLARARRIAHFADCLRISTPEALERVAELEAARAARRATRREFLGNLARGAAAAGLASLAGPFAGTANAKPPGGGGGGNGPSIGIVGAGLAGMVCAKQLLAAGISATIYEAEANRAGGRCWSFPNFVPGLAAERGGEFIDNLHTTMLGFAKQLNLARADFGKVPGETAYFLNGQHFHESEIVDRYRDFVASIRTDLHFISGDVTADNHTPDDVTIDNVSLEECLDGHFGAHAPADPILKEAIRSAYEGEYGLEIFQQSCLNFILFIHADKRSKMAWFGVYSDERWYIVGGNDQIPQGIAADLPGQFEFGRRLTAARKLADGRIELTFQRGVRVHDAVVFAIPFTVLRGVALHESLGLSDDKKFAIDNLGYGNNAKLAIGFAGRPWATVQDSAPEGSNGTAYSNLPNVQVVFQSSPNQATDSKAILVDYSSGARGAGLNPNNAQNEAEQFLTDLDQVWPGAKASAMRDNKGKLTKVHLEHWPSNPNSRGSYTCYTLGQFTSIAGNEGKPEGNVYFCGEHANSFYVWQGFMEGACLSGIDAASQILADVKAGNL